MPVSRQRKKRKSYTTTQTGVSTPSPRNTKWFSIIAVCLSAWFLLYPHPFLLVFYSVVLLPLIGLVLHGAGIKPTISSLMPKDNIGGIGLVLILPMFGLLIWGTNDNWLDTFATLLVPGMVAFVITITILLTTHSITTTNKKSNQGTVVLILAIYSFAATNCLNCIGDYSEATITDISVINKRVKEGGRHTSYVLTTDGVAYGSNNTLTVSRKLYESVAIGNIITLHHKHGLFGAPWTYVTKKDEPFMEHGIH